MIDNHNMGNELVRCSRAGDVFHYRWAARRCLKLIYPKSTLNCIVIEGSKESKSRGEYVIDLTEYRRSTDCDEEEVTYFQLKHSTQRSNKFINLSELKNTIEGFSNRYSDILKENCRTKRRRDITFSIVTNRPINEKLKTCILAFSKGAIAKKRTQKVFKKYTKLKKQDLKNFCSSLELLDGEGDYQAQKYELHYEISQLLAGTANSSQVDSIISLVADHALPHASGRRIVREDIS